MAKRPDRTSVPYRTAIVVLGMHRSGTSALARVVNFLGAALPRHLLPAGESNPRGHWEPAPLVALHDQLLASLDSSWDDWRAPAPRWRETELTAKFSGRIQQALDDEYGNAPLFVLKDPRLCRTLPYWMSVLEKTGIRTAPLIIVRNPLEVAESLRERDGISFEKAMLLWLRHYLDAEFETRHLARNIIALDVLLDDWKSIAVQSGGRLGLTWPRSLTDAAQDVREFLDMELHNHRATLAELEAHTEVPSWVKSAYRALTHLCDEPKAADPKRELDRVRQAFAESSKVFGVEAFAQTVALKQAEAAVTQATRRADGADETRMELSQERAAHEDLATRYEALATRSRKLEIELPTITARATEAEAALLQFRTEDYQNRALNAEKRVAALMKDVAALERSRNEIQQTMVRVTADASELKAMAEHVSKRTEWIEAELKKQSSKSDKSKGEVEETRSKFLAMSNELQAAVSTAMAVTKELSVTKEKLHAQEKRAFKLTADAARIAELEADERAAQTEIAELRAELAESWSLAGGRFADPMATPSEPVGGSNQFDPSDVQARAQRVEEDLRFERMHVQQLERRLNSWAGLASAALRKATRLGGKPAPQRRKPVRRLVAPPVPSR